MTESQLIVIGNWFYGENNANGRMGQNKWCNKQHLLLSIIAGYVFNTDFFSKINTAQKNTCILSVFLINMKRIPESWEVFVLVCQTVLNIHWASKETYSFLEWCPLKSTASKWRIFGLVLATVLLIIHVKKQRNRKCQKLDKCLQITTSPISKITEAAPFPAHRLRTFQ